MFITVFPEIGTIFAMSSLLDHHDERKESLFHFRTLYLSLSNSTFHCQDSANCLHYFAISKETAVLFPLNSTPESRVKVQKNNTILIRFEFRGNLISKLFGENVTPSEEEEEEHGC